MDIDESEFFSGIDRFSIVEADTRNFLDILLLTESVSLEGCFMCWSIIKTAPLRIGCSDIESVT